MPAKLTEGIRQRFAHSLTTHGHGVLTEGVGRFAAPLTSRHGLKRRLMVAMNDNEQRVWTPGDLASAASRASAAWGPDLDGYFVAYGINQPRIGLSPVGLPSYLKEPQCTNLVSVAANANPAQTIGTTATSANPTGITGMNFNGVDPAAVLSIVDDSAELANAKLERICTSGKVYKLDNSAGTIITTVTVTGAVVANGVVHTSSAYVRGSGSVRLGYNNVGGSSQAMGAGYAQMYNINAAGATGQTLSIGANPGAIVYFILMQLEANVSATTPVVVAGAQVTRSRDVVNVQYSMPRGAPQTWFVDVVPNHIATNGNSIITGATANVAGSFQMRVFLAAGGFARWDGGGFSLLSANTITHRQRAKIAATADATATASAVCLNGAGGFITNGSVVPQELNQLVFGGDSLASDGNSCSMYYHEARVLRRRVTSQQLQAMTL